jgi:hypothetical protein
MIPRVSASHRVAERDVRYRWEPDTQDGMFDNDFMACRPWHESWLALPTNPTINFRRARRWR